VGRPRLGEVIPRSVDCTVTIDISRCTGETKNEWEALRERDVVFLVCIQNPQANAVQQVLEAEKIYSSTRATGGRGDDHGDGDDSGIHSIDYVSLLGIKYVRGGELFEMQDEAHVVLNDPSK